MKCPHCGKELKEGYLICENCGEEIRIVPDFEPEIENSITETLSTLASMQEGKDTEEMPKLDETDVSLLQESEDTAGNGNKKIWVILSLVLLFVVALISYGLYTYHVEVRGFQIQFCFSNMWVLGNKLRSSDLVASLLAFQALVSAPLFFSFFL